MSQPKPALRAPEGKWLSKLERTCSNSFSPDLAPALSAAELRDPESGSTVQLVLLSTQQLLCIYNPQSPNREHLRVIDFRHLGPSSGSGGLAAYPTCHAHTSTANDEFDLAMGFSNGEIVLLSLRAQLRAPSSNSRPVTSLTLNIDGSANASRCVSLSWLPGSEGGALMAAHRDGGVLLHHRVVGSSSDTKLLARTSSQSSLRPPVTQLQSTGCGGGANAAAVSPDGRHVAVAGKDGVLRVYAYPSGGLMAGFKSYYGGLLCCCWSPDGRYVAAGGEDDMLALYGLTERCVVAYCQGHSSWVSGIAFDPWMCHAENGGKPGAVGDAEVAQQQQAADAAAGAAPAPAGGADRVYRLASVGQDCQLALWDVVVSEESVAAAQLASSAHSSPERERLPPGLPPSPSKRRAGSIGGNRGGSSRSASPSKRGMAAAVAAGLGWQRGGGGDQGALPPALTAGIIAAPLPRADWPLVTPVAQQKAHMEPACSALFTRDALFTACHGSSLRRWARPPLMQAAAVRRNDSLQSIHSDR